MDRFATFLFLLGVFLMVVQIVKKFQVLFIRKTICSRHEIIFIEFIPHLSHIYPALSRFIPLYHALSRLYHALSRFITLYPALSRIFNFALSRIYPAFIPLYHALSRFITLYHALSHFIPLYPALSRFIKQWWIDWWILSERTVRIQKAWNNYWNTVKRRWKCGENAVKSPWDYREKCYVKCEDKPTVTVTVKVMVRDGERLW